MFQSLISGSYCRERKRKEKDIVFNFWEIIFILFRKISFREKKNREEQNKINLPK